MFYILKYIQVCIEFFLISKFQFNRLLISFQVTNDLFIIITTSIFTTGTHKKSNNLKNETISIIQNVNICFKCFSYSRYLCFYFVQHNIIIVSYLSFYLTGLRLKQMWFFLCGFIEGLGGLLYEHLILKKKNKNTLRYFINNMYT